MRILKNKPAAENYSEARYANTLSNIHYAPGFATYGLRGYSGKTSEDSPFIYVSDLDYETNKEAILNKINNNLSLSKRDNSIYHTDISYKRGDLVLTHGGSVYRIIENTVQDQNSDINILKYRLILNKLYTIENNSFKEAKDTFVSNLNIGDFSERSADRAIEAALTIKLTDNNKAISIVSKNNEEINLLTLEFDSDKNVWCFNSDNDIVLNADNVLVKNNKPSGNIRGYSNITDINNKLFFDEIEKLKQIIKFSNKDIKTVNQINTTATIKKFNEDIESLLKDVKLITITTKDSEGFLIERNVFDMSKLDYKSETVSIADYLNSCLVNIKDSIISYNFYYSNLKYNLFVKDAK